MYDHFGNYTLAFILAGVPPLLGAGFMTCIYKVGNNSRSNNAQTTEATKKDLESAADQSLLQAAVNEDGEEEKG